MTTHTSTTDPSDFDPFKKEQELRAESDTWDTSNPEEALPEDIPVIDLSEYFQTKEPVALEKISDQLRVACEQTGFFSIIGHGIEADVMSDMFSMAKSFHRLPLNVKQEILMDRGDWPIKGAGYLPVKNKKLPSRDKGNLNEAFIVKTDDAVSLDDNQWIAPELLSGFRETVTVYSMQMENLGKELLPIFATALEMPADYFNEAFVGLTWRLRMTHYPAVENKLEDEFGIAPHVDTTFCTILAQDQPGLTIFSEKRKKWIRAPLIENAYIVNSGELLRQWTNDRFLSVKHFANNNFSDQSRYSIPFFLNANRHYKMECVPTCKSADNPAKYPTISYAESQAVAQGE
jgi:isopenicillin N synthase-like dioxygenase